MRGSTIPIVEDDPGLRSIHATIPAQEGCRLPEATDWEKGLRPARKARPDLVLMIFPLPSISGLALTGILKGSRVTREIPIIGVSGCGVDPEEARVVGCRELLRKPLDPERLTAAVAEALLR
ncbi:MAG TPA: response regulator [Longimicrobiales bacterium]|jgi:CheY-like chemotaxis protein